MKQVFILLYFAFLFLQPVSASDYVFPYPSYMPGHTLYSMSRTIDYVKQWWHWGTFASINYHMALSDKYLVEAKTLIEYKQYFLAVDALTRSDRNIDKLLPLIEKASQEGKDIYPLSRLIESELESHVAVLDNLRRVVPKTVVWQPEKVQATRLDLSDDISDAIIRRNKVTQLLPHR